MTKEIYHHPWRTLIEYANKRKETSRWTLNTTDTLT
jgi:hypothetical protein